MAHGEDGTGLHGGQDDLAVALLRVCYNGPLAEGERVLRPLRAFGSPIADLIKPMAYTALQSMYDAGAPSGLRAYWKSNALTDLTDEAIDIMVAHCATRPAPQCGMALGQLGGAVSRVGQDETAFNHRNVLYDFISAGQCKEKSSRPGRSLRPLPSSYAMPAGHGYTANALNAFKSFALWTQSTTGGTIKHTWELRRLAAGHHGRDRGVRPARVAQLDVPGRGHGGAGPRTRDCGLVETYVFNSDKCLALFKP
jgi:hypothetical protein